MNNLTSVNTPVEKTMQDLPDNKGKNDVTTTLDNEQLSTDADKFLSFLNTPKNDRQEIDTHNHRQDNSDEITDNQEDILPDVNVAKNQETSSQFSGNLFSFFAIDKSDKQKNDEIGDTEDIKNNDSEQSCSNERVLYKHNDEFDMNQQINHDDSKEQFNKDNEHIDNTTETLSGASILSSFFQNTPLQQKATEKIDQPSLNVNELSDKIADRILISQPDANGNAEIRIQIKQDIIPDTEVRITKTGDGIKIDFISMSDDSLRLLNQHIDTLSHNLNNRFDGKVVVQVNSGEFSQGNNDGRSRQQRNLYDEIVEE